MSATVFTIILISLLLINFCFLYRNEKTLAFKLKLNKMAFEYNMRHLYDNNLSHPDAFIWFSRKYSYEDVLFSLKPLKLECWFDEEEIKRINT